MNIKIIGAILMAVFGVANEVAATSAPSTNPAQEWTLAGLLVAAIVYLVKKSQQQDERLERLHAEQLQAQKEASESIVKVTAATAQAVSDQAEATCQMRQAIDNLTHEIRSKPCFAMDDGK